MDTILERIRGMKMESGIMSDMSDGRDEGYTRTLLLLLLLPTLETYKG